MEGAVGFTPSSVSSDDLLPDSPLKPNAASASVPALLTVVEDANKYVDTSTPKSDISYRSSERNRKVIESELKVA